MRGIIEFSYWNSVSPW